MKNKIINLRQLGIYTTKDGYKIKDNILYRGSHLSAIDDDSIKLVESLHIKELIDFRGDDEIEINGEDYKPKDCHCIRVQAHRDDCPYYKKDFLINYMNNINTSMEDFYQIQAKGSIAYKYGLDCILHKKFPMYFHCTMGKDRTGMFAALVLSLLGVDRETIVQDYLESNIQVAKAFPGFDMGKLGTVDESWIRSFFKEIDDNYDGIEDYLFKVYSINKDDIERIRRNCLENYESISY